MLRCLGSVLGPTCTRPAQAGETCICNGRTSPRARERVGSSPVSWIGPRSSRDPTSWEAAAKSEMVVGAGFGRRLTEDIRDRRAVPRLESGCGSLRSPSGSSRASSRARRSLRMRSRRAAPCSPKRHPPTSRPRRSMPRRPSVGASSEMSPSARTPYSDRPAASLRSIGGRRRPSCARRVTCSRRWATSPRWRRSRRCLRRRLLRLLRRQRRAST
jgi:hypothetical protein